MSVHEWPPVDEDVELWARIDNATNDDEKCRLWNILGRWMDETSTVVGELREDGTWEDLELDEDKFRRFLDGDS